MPLPDPHPLPAYDFDPALSDDENFLTWAVVYARWSSSRRGHMAALIVKGDGVDEPASARPLDRVLSHANNQPAIYLPPSSKGARATQPPQAQDQGQGSAAPEAPQPPPRTENLKAVPEVHAEAFAISLAARRGTPIDGATIYVTYPPCAECSRLILACGIRRCVFRKTMYRKVHAGLLAAADVAGVEMKGTGLAYDFLPRQGQSQAQPDKDTAELGPEELRGLLAQEGALESAREARARRAWEKQRETTDVTRARVDAFWRKWLGEHREADARVQEAWRTWDEDVEPRIAAATRKEGGKQGKAERKEQGGSGQETRTSARHPAGRGDPMEEVKEEELIAASPTKRPRVEGQAD